MTCPDNSKPWRRNTPGSPCCDDCPCTIVKHTFSAGPLSDCWTLKTGSWNDAALVDGYASATGAVEAWHVTPHPDDPYPSDVRVRVRGAAGSILRIVLSASGDVATGDALIVELAPGADCGTLKLYQRQGGVEDVLATLAVYGAVVDEWHDLRACYDPETTVLTGSILPHDQTSWRQVSADVEAHTDGAYAGFASGTDDQSDFDSFDYRKLWYDRIITPLCPQMTVEETVAGNPGPASSYEVWWNVGYGNETPIASIYILHPFTGAQLSLFPRYQLYSAEDFEYKINTVLAAFSGGETWTVSAEIIDSGYGYTWLKVVATGDLANKQLLAPDESGQGWIKLEDRYFWQQVYHDRGNGVNNEQQTITVTYPGDEGCRVFSLSWGGQTTDPISTSADAATVQAALETLCGAGNVSVTGPAGAWVVEFVGELAETDVAMLAADTTVCGNCLDYSYYYEPETERVTCSTCKINCGLIPAQYGIVGNAPLACLADAKSGTWTIAPVGLCNMGIGGYDYLPPLQSDADWIGLQSLQSTGAGEIVFSSDRGVHEIPHYVGFEICSPTDTTVYRCYWSYPDEYLDVWITQDEETLTRELHIQPVGGVQYDGGESLSGIVCDRISVQVCRLEFGAVVGAIATRVYGGERELISYVSSISIELSEWTAPTYAGLSVPESTLCKFFVTRHAQNDPDCPGCQSCDSDQCSPGNRPNEVVRITIPTGVVPGYSGAEPFPVEIDLASLFGSYVADTVPEDTMCRWQALILDAWRCSTITCPTGGNPVDGLYLGNSSVPAQCFKCGTARNVSIEDDVYDPPGWGYYPFTWNGICLFATASIRNPFGESLGGWGVTLSLGYQSSVDLPTEKGDVPFAFPLYGSTAMYCFKYNPTGNEYVWYKVQGRATYVASFAADGSGCTEEIVLTKIPAGSPVVEEYLPVEPEGVYEGVWPDTIRLNPRP